MSEHLHRGYLQNGIGKPGKNDVLCGRGKSVMYHPGNRYLSLLVKTHKEDYIASPKHEKHTFAKLIVNEIYSLSLPGRFLKSDSTLNVWYEIGYKKALDKTRQALRENAPALLHEFHNAIMDDTQNQINVKKKQKASSDRKNGKQTSHVQVSVGSKQPHSTNNDTCKHKANLDSSSEVAQILASSHVLQSREKETNQGDFLNNKRKTAAYHNNDNPNNFDATKYLTNELFSITKPRQTETVIKLQHLGLLSHPHLLSEQKQIQENKLSHLESDDMTTSKMSKGSTLEPNTNKFALSEVKQLKEAALTKAEERKLKESHDMLENIYEFERKMHFCRMKGCSLLDIADTLYHLGVIRIQLGNKESALEALHESLSLRQQKLRNEDLVVIQTFLLIAAIQKTKTWDI